MGSGGGSMGLIHGGPGVRRDRLRWNRVRRLRYDGGPRFGSWDMSPSVKSGDSTMKHTRVTAVSFAAVLSPLAGIAARKGLLLTSSGSFGHDRDLKSDNWEIPDGRTLVSVTRNSRLEN